MRTQQSNKSAVQALVDEWESDIAEDNLNGIDSSVQSLLLRQLKTALAQDLASQGAAPVVGDDLESKYNVLRDLLQRSWREVHIGTKKYQLTLTVTPEYLERIESALTGRGSNGT